MADRLKEIPAKILAWWNKYTSKQKTFIIGGVAVVIFTFAILLYVLSRPQYVQLTVATTTKEAAEILDILDSNSIKHKESSDGLKIEVEASKISEANIALGAAGYVPDDYSLDDALKSSMTNTASDTEKRYKLYLEKQLEKDFQAMSMIKTAKVNLDIPSQDGTLAAEKRESSAYIQLEIDGIFTSANAATVARAAATALGNATTSNITIVDSDANLLFAGGDDYSTAGIANSYQELQNQAQSQVANNVKKVLYGTNQYNNVEVTSYLSMDFSVYKDTVKEYYANDDRTEGMIASQTTYESENQSGAGGIPGTDSNVGNTYVYQNSENSTSSQNETDTQYLPNEHSRYSESAAGAIDLTNSSISIAAIRYRKVYEDDVRNRGLLDGDGMTWESYKLANAQDTRVEVEPEFYTLVSNATGIATDRITIVAYETPLFYDSEKTTVSATTIMSIILFILIIALLTFVVLRSMLAGRKKDEEDENEEPDIPLVSTPEEELPDIDAESKSEERRVIEKFVDENPEAAASLLRNWLNEDWA